MKKNDLQEEESFEEDIDIIRDIIRDILHGYAVDPDLCVGGRKSCICNAGAGLAMYSICRAFVMYSGHAAVTC